MFGRFWGTWAARPCYARRRGAKTSASRVVVVLRGFAARRGRGRACGVPRVRGPGLARGRVVAELRARYAEAPAGPASGRQKVRDLAPPRPASARRRRRGRVAAPPRSATWIFRGRVAAPPRSATWIFRGRGSTESPAGRRGRSARLLRAIRLRADTKRNCISKASVDSGSAPRRAAGRERDADGPLLGHGRVAGVEALLGPADLGQARVLPGLFFL